MKINDLLLRLTKEKYLNRWIIFLIDLFLSVFSTVTSLALVSYILDWNYTDQIILTVFLASLFCSTASFLVCQTYKGIIRHSAFTETGRIAMSSSLKVATILPVLLFTTGLLSFRGFLLGSVVDFFLTFFILTIFRAFLITLYTFMVSSIVSNRKDKLFIFGHEDSSPALLNDSFLRENSSYQVEGFLRFGQRVSMRIGLYKVYFITDQDYFSRLVNRYNIKAILFTDYKAVKEECERLVRFCEKEKVRMLLLPSLDELKGGKLKMRALPEVRIEDLLGREEIRINMEEIAGSLKGKVVLLDFSVFQSPAGAPHNLMLRELYNEYAKQGLEIYQVSLDADEHYWKTAADNLPWVCVRDGNGVYSTNVAVYNVRQVPSIFLINRNNELKLRGEDIEDLEAAVKSLL